MEINQERWKEIKKLRLRAGTGKELSGQVCVMQAVDYVTSGGFSDHPECACPALTQYAIRLNDQMDDESRQKLKPLIPKLIGTRDGKHRERTEFLVHHSITKTLPILADALDLKSEAKTLRQFKFGEWTEMRAFCLELKPKMREAMRARLAAASAAAYAAYAAYASAAAASAAAASAYAAAYASAASADAAYASAVAGAADAAYAYASAAASAYAAASAADASSKAVFWREIKSKIWDSSLASLKEACAIRAKGKTKKKAKS